MKSPLRNFLIILAVFVLILAAFSFVENPIESAEEISLDSFVQRVEEGSVKSILIESGNKMTVGLEDGTEAEVFKESVISLAELLEGYGIEPSLLREVDITVKDYGNRGFFYNILLPLLPILIIGGFIFLMMRQVQGVNNRAMSFGKSSADDKGEKEREKREKVTFSDVAGAKEAKEELKEIVEFLKFPKKFADMGAKLPKGALLVGSPGTGKTLIARAVAGEADVPFFHISGSEFVEMFVGVGASRVRSLFAKAKKAAPCIVFIDEIDAVGRQRGSGLGGSHDEREQTLNQILVEMDGFDPNIGVIVLAATNRPDVLDPALLRPGRFDRRVVVGLPDITDREAILTLHAKNKHLKKGADMKAVAQRTPGFSGADLANVMNEAAILSVRRKKKEVSSEELFESIEKVMLGPERKSYIMSEKERKMTAYHEAGHAIVAHMLPHADPVHKISIISRGNAGGYTIKLPDRDKHFHTKSEFLDDIAAVFGGYVVEKEIFGELSTGPSSDLKHATRLARSLVTQYGMSDKAGPSVYGVNEDLVFLGKEIHEQKNYSEETASLIDREVSRLLREGQERAKEVITKHRDKLDAIVEVLLEKESIEREELEKIVGTPKVVA